MAYRKSTLRKLRPVTRQYAKLITEAESAVRRMKKLLHTVELLEADSVALLKARDLNKARVDMAAQRAAELVWPDLPKGARVSVEVDDV